MNVQSSDPGVSSGQDLERRARIVAAALTVFAEHGFRGATMKRIAEAAEISPGLVYWYFQDKAHLFRAVLSEIVDGFVSESGLEHPEVGDLPEKALKRLVASYLRHFSRSPLPSLPLLAEIIRTPDLAASFFEAGPGRGIRLLTAYLRSQQAAGHLPSFDTGLAAQLLVGMMASQLVLAKLLPSIPATRDFDAVAETIVGVFLNGVRAGEKGTVS